MPREVFHNELVKHLPMPSSEDSWWQPGLALTLVSPMGVGKTTIAKLAVRYVCRTGPQAWCY
jgi:flagellar biosynthesis GTPase FlhF